MSQHNKVGYRPDIFLPFKYTYLDYKFLAKHHFRQSSIFWCVVFWFHLRYFLSSHSIFSMTYWLFSNMFKVSIFLWILKFSFYYWLLTHISLWPENTLGKNLSAFKGGESCTVSISHIWDKNCKRGICRWRPCSGSLWGS